MKHTIALATFLACILFPASSLLAQGPLIPPAAPAPTMKTLAQIEPRTDLQATPAPPGVDTTNASYHFIITQPGSYYLSANLGVSKANGIQINAEGVTLDLGGFQVARVSASGGHGIEIAATSHRAAVRNGSIKGFTYGVRSMIVTNFPRGCAFRDLAVSGCNSYGLHAGEAAVLEACRAHDNTGFAGISTSDASTLTNCTAINNVTTYGIAAEVGSTLTGCTVRGSTGSIALLIASGATAINCTASGNDASTAIAAGSGATLTGCAAYNNTGSNAISIGSGATLHHCSAYDNTVTYGIFASNACTLAHCAAYSNNGTAAITAGIRAGAGTTLSHCSSRLHSSSAVASATTGIGFDLSGDCTIVNCTASNNQGDGMRLVGTRIHATGNTCSSNNTGGVGGGIHLTSAANGCRIDGNHCTGGVRAFFIEGTDNLIVRNSAQGASVTNYDIIAGNHDAARVPSPGASFASTSPWVNFSF